MISRLNGTRILITREKRQAQSLADLVEQYGGSPIVAPLIAVSCKNEKKQQKIVNHLSDYEWIFFTSANGVHCFFRNLQAQGFSKMGLSTLQFGAVGSKTEDALKTYGYSADFVPSTYNADVMAEEFLADFSGQAPILLIRGSMSRSTLPEEFAKNRVSYETLEVYETLFNYDIRFRLNRLIREKALDMLTFTSPSTVNAFLEMVDTDLMQTIQYIPVACIGTTTEQPIRSAGFVNVMVPEVFTMEYMIAEIGRAHV